MTSFITHGCVIIKSDNPIRQLHLTDHSTERTLLDICLYFLEWSLELEHQMINLGLFKWRAELILAFPTTIL